MSNIKFVIHLFVLLLLQLTILDNIQLHSYVYINIYILAIYILPYRLRNATILFFGFFLGLFVDLANHTMGIHAAATTLLAYILSLIHISSLQVSVSGFNIEAVLKFHC